MQQEDFISVRDVHKSFRGPVGPVAVLTGVNLSIERGEYLAIVGRSGSGKSTLLNLLAGLDQPTSGAVVIGNNAIQEMDEAALATWRGTEVGIVFQFFQLLPTLTNLENIILPMDFVGRIPPAERKARALNLLARVELEAHADKFPSALSGGEQQRVAIARALANDPALLVADEPTGNLDSTTANSVHRLFSELVAEGRTVIEVTHEQIAQQGYTRVVNIADGKLVQP